MHLRGHFIRDYLLDFARRARLAARGSRRSFARATWRPLPSCARRPRDDARMINLQNGLLSTAGFRPALRLTPRKRPASASFRARVVPRSEAVRDRRRDRGLNNGNIADLARSHKHTRRSATTCTGCWADRLARLASRSARCSGCAPVLEGDRKNNLRCPGCRSPMRQLSQRLVAAQERNARTSTRAAHHVGRFCTALRRSSQYRRTRSPFEIVGAPPSPIQDRRQQVSHCARPRS